MKRTIELIRVSTESQAASDRASIPAQRSINQRTAQAYGLTIVRSIELSDVSGAAVLLAPEIQELVTLIADPYIHGVVAREFSRLMRPENFGDYALLQAFADTNTVLYLPEGPIDFASKTGRLMGTIRAAIAGMERTEILERIWGAKEEKRKAGGFAQSPICLPFGVTYDGAWSYTADAERVREAFRLFLSGDTAYTSIGRKIGMEAYNIRVILKNPIYTGWRVIDKRRDTSAAGKYATKNGRQGDRRKIMRAPEDVIRIKVLEPLISESDFNQAQRLMELKKVNHWSTREGYEHRFTYNGFMNCICGGLVYTKFRRDDYYVCKGRCGVGYMRRDRLDPELDRMFAQRLTSPRFLQRIVNGLKVKQPATNTERLTEQLKQIEGKRQRVLDAYFEGILAIPERDQKLTEINTNRRVVSDLIARERPRSGVTADSLANAFGPFKEFDLLSRDDKRQLLNTLTPSIVVADYEISGLFIGLKENLTAAVYLENDRIWLPIGLKAA